MAAIYRTKDFFSRNADGASSCFSNISGLGYLILALRTRAIVIIAGIRRTAKESLYVVNKSSVPFTMAVTNRMTGPRNAPS